MATPSINQDIFAAPAKMKPFGPRASRFVARTPEEDARINVLVGSVRSAKTWAVMTKIVACCFCNIGGQKLITGASKQAIMRNVLNDLFEIIGESNYTYNRQTGECTILGARWVVIGAADEGSERAIRGMTVGVAICDEIVLMPRSFCMQLFARMSPLGARLYATTNPDTPYHWFKKEVLDSKDLIKGLGKDLWWQTWTMDDNPHLTEEFKEFTQRQYTGVFYQRFVLGRWVVAGGAIYRDVLTDDIFYDDTTRPVGLLNFGTYVERWVPIDVGTVNAFAAIDVYDDGVTLWFEREYYWDSRANSLQKTNAEYATDLIEGDGQQWLGFDKEERTWPGVIIDPSAASFRAELVSRGVYVMDAVNDVSEGIRKVSVMMARKRIRIHKRCVNTIREMQTYEWDEKSAARGKEQPVKSNDHACDSLRYMIATRISDYRLAS